jgi:ribonuclease PH
MARHDGRRNNALRPVNILSDYISSAEGSLMIECGKTRVICTATVDDSVPPFLRGSGSGWITAEYGMLPRSSPSRIIRETRRGGIKGRTQEIQRMIGRSLRAVADLEELGERRVIVDCDVVEADGGTRTASITGGYVAMAKVLDELKIRKKVLKGFVAAVSVGILEGKVILDLDYFEDSQAEVDMNVVMTEKGEFVEIQGTAEGRTFGEGELSKMIQYARSGVKQLIKRQRKVLL